MKDQHSTAGAVVGVTGLAAGIAAAAADLPVFALVAGAAALVAGLFALLSGRHGQAREVVAVGLHGDITELEAALAAQVQARISAEEAVRSLGEQLAMAQRESPAKAGQLNMPLAERTGDALTDAATGLFSQEYFLVAVDARIAAARRHLRPVGVVMLEVVEGLRTEQPQPAHPAMVAEAVNATLREADTACHMRDGRFALVLEDTSENGAIWTVERIRRSLNEQAQNLTLRAGIACYPAHAFGASELLSRANDALTSARDWQQDRIEVATGD
ncbi:MAG TPA: diguanylate cyclase [Acidimicrobiales bacterium]|nr:diguanylate cyclase [Acidimicrobiales bacterium]